MSTFQFLHAADLHLDSPMRGLAADQDDGRDGPFYRVTRRALKNLVDLAIERRVAFVIIVGDCYDGPWQDFNTPIFFKLEMNRLREVQIPVYLLRGNHDAANKMTKALTLPDNVYSFDTERPQSHYLEAFNVVIHGQSYPRPDITEDLSQRYPRPEPHLLNIGVLHTCADGREGHERYAPCKVEDLKRKGYAYWALGHIHKREELSSSPYIVFPGNLQGRHVRETGPKGATLVTCTGNEVTKVEPVDLDVARWARCRVDVSRAHNLDTCVKAIETALSVEVNKADGRPLAVRVELVGRSPAHSILAAKWDQVEAEVKSIVLDAAGHSGMRLEQVIQLTEAPKAALPDTDWGGALATLNEVIAEWHQQPKTMANQLDDLKRKVRGLEVDPALWEESHLKSLLSQVGVMVHAQLAAAAGGSV